MDAHPPTTADFAASDARAARLSTQDCMVLIGWLAERVGQLERLVQPEDYYRLPELPSRMNGFACCPRREEAVREAMGKLRVEGIAQPPTGDPSNG
jgi:hypothetical protein